MSRRVGGAMGRRRPCCRCLCLSSMLPGLRPTTIGREAVDEILIGHGSRRTLRNRCTGSSRMADDATQPGSASDLSQHTRNEGMRGVGRDVVTLDRADGLIFITTLPYADTDTAVVTHNGAWFCVCVAAW